MNVIDPVSDLLSRLRNGQKAGHEVVSIPASKMKIAIVHLMKEEGFVKAFKCIRDTKQGLIKVALKYRTEDNTLGVIQGIHRKSKPGRRLYVAKDKIPFVRNGYGVAILSTSQGIMTCREARKRNIGGEYLCAIY